MGTLTQNIKTINQDGYYTTDSHDFFDWILENIDYDYSTKTIVVNEGTHRIIGYRGNLTSVVVPNYLSYGTNKFRSEKVVRLTQDGLISGISNLEIVDFGLMLTIGDENASYSLFGESNSTVKTIKFNDAVINKNAFKYCTALKTASGADTITKIGDAAFQQTALTSISITKATEIGEWAFANCGQLANVTLCESLTRIPNYCFINAGLIKITIPARITSIGSQAFNNCSKMSIIEFKPTTPPSIGANAFAGTPSGLLIKLSVNLQTYTNCLGTFNRYDIGIQPYINQLNRKGFAAGAKVYVSNQTSQISTCNASGVFTLTYKIVI